VFFQLFLLRCAYSFFPFNNFLVSRIKTFLNLLFVFHLAPCYRCFPLGGFLILVFAAIAEPFQFVIRRIVFAVYEIWSCGIPTQMQWYHFVHPPSHSRPSSKLSTISLQTPHSLIPAAPVAFQNFRKGFIQSTLHISAYYFPETYSNRISNSRLF